MQMSQNTPFGTGSGADSAVSPPFLKSLIHPASDQIISITHIAASSGSGITARGLSLPHQNSLKTGPNSGLPDRIFSLLIASKEHGAI